MEPVRAAFVVYSRGYCHLCDELVAELQAVLAAWPHAAVFAVDVVDVDADEQLEGRYGERVPVLEFEGRELCHFRLDAEKVREVLGTLG
ncbi:MAG TPA: glutaredoxin family protein [Rhodocyclaceae bacterium]|nr:glutaredoxin family protein [Rhodocyclaceae bacterium]HNH34296.1 glutaredoxin family protein [Rhodocyclaceae bacterium]